MKTEVAVGCKCLCVCECVITERTDYRSNHIAWWPLVFVTRRGVDWGWGGNDSNNNGDDANNFYVNKKKIAGRTAMKKKVRVDKPSSDGMTRTGRCQPDNWHAKRSLLEWAFRSLHFSLQTRTKRVALPSSGRTRNQDPRTWRRMSVIWRSSMKLWSTGKSGQVRASPSKADSAI